MQGTLPAPAPDADRVLQNVRIVLVRPEFGGNIGSVCRAMKNMGLSRLFLVAPADYDRMESVRMAYKALDVLEGARVVPTLPESVGDCALVLGTTRKGGLYRKHAVELREGIGRVARAAAGGGAALVFGPEKDGLSNEEVGLCHALLSIPTHEGHPTLNLAQAAAICCYELYLAVREGGGRDPGRRLASARLRERMIERWRQALLAVGFLDAQRERHIMLALRRIWGAGDLFDEDARILIGMAQQVLWYARRHGPETPPGQPADEARPDASAEEPEGSP